MQLGKREFWVIFLGPRPVFVREASRYVFLRMTTTIALKYDVCIERTHEPLIFRFGSRPKPKRGWISSPVLCLHRYGYECLKTYLGGRGHGERNNGSSCPKSRRVKKDCFSHFLEGQGEGTRVYMCLYKTSYT